MKRFYVNCSSKYPVYIGQGVLSSVDFYTELSAFNLRVALITDSNLSSTLGQKVLNNLQKQGISAELFEFPAGEENKTRATKQALEDQLMEKEYGRDTCIIALGGGIVTDLAGFLAATYARGVPVIYVPTSLMGMVDASLGGKTGVNTHAGKNLIGTITQPHAVFIDTVLLRSLSEPDFASGMVEMIKHGLVADHVFFHALASNILEMKHKDLNYLTEMIYTSCMIKKNIIEADEQENGLRYVLNFGHTIGHAIEVIEHYKISHGQAVAIGMLVECYISVLSGLLDMKVVHALANILHALGIPLSTSAFDDPLIFRKALVMDKKSQRKIPHFVMLAGIGQVCLNGKSYTSTVEPDVLNEALHWAATKAQQLAQ